MYSDVGSASERKAVFNSSSSEFAEDVIGWPRRAPPNRLLDSVRRISSRCPIAMSVCLPTV